MHRLNQCNRVFDRRLLHDAVAEIENVAGAAGGLIENLSGAAPNLGFVGQQHERIEVALHGAVVADRLPGVVEPHAPIDADHLSAGFGQQRQQAPDCRWRS